MDKFYFTPPEGNAPKSIRAMLSELTNIALMVQEQECDIAELQKCLLHLQATEHYQQDPQDPQAQENKRAFAGRLEVDLMNACDYWEESWRYSQCWPVIAPLLA